MKHSVPHQFSRFALVGATGTAVQYTVLWIGVNVLAQSAPASSAAGYLLGSIVNYLLNYAFTFASGKSHFEAATKYYAVMVVGFCLNTGLMEIFVRSLKLNYWVAQVITTGLGLLWNFVGSRWWAFRNAHV
jgi:putative flippase GtrA